MIRGPYCDGDITLGSGAVVKCGKEVYPRECKYFQCEKCAEFMKEARYALDLLAAQRKRQDEEWADFHGKR